MRFLLSALGSAGDVHPFVAIGQSLAARGHDVTILASPHFADRIRRAGVAFAPFGAAGDYERLLRRPELWQPRRAARFILDELLDQLPQAYETTRALATPGTILVGSTLSWAVRLVQETTGLPAATVHLSPLCLWSADDPAAWPVVGDLRWLPRGARRRVLDLVDRFVVDRLVAPRLNAFRTQLGLSPVTRVWSRWIHSPRQVIAAWPAWFAPVQADWPPHAVAAGFPMFDEGQAPLDEALMAFLAAGTPPVGITPGSAMAHGREFIARALAACEASGFRAVVVTPYRDQLPARLPLPVHHVHHVPYTPFTALLPRLAALIHHGGIGTGAQALAAGIPQVVAPFAHDQFDNAARLQRLGVARTVDGGAAVARWSAALGAVTSDRNVALAVQRQSARMSDGGSPADAIALLLAALGAARIDPSPDDGRRAAADNAGPRPPPDARMTTSRFRPPLDELANVRPLLRSRGYAIVDAASTARIAGVDASALSALAPAWDDLPADPYLRDGGHYRRRRHASCIVDGTTITAVPQRAHWQPLEYNALHGGMQRWFEPIDGTVLAADAWRRLIVGIGALCTSAQSAGPWFVEAHQFRIDTAGGIGRPTPEGAHRDGVDFVAVVLVDRLLIKGGETRVFDAHGPDGRRFTMDEPWTTLLLDDARVIHETTPIQPVSDATESGHRDTLVVTFRAGGFQGG